MEKKKILIYGYGNPGRMDDGLGNEFVNLCEQHLKEFNEFIQIETDSNYQLNIEDAEIISQYDFVFFTDASQENIENYSFTKVDPDKAQIEFTMHAVSVSYIVHIARTIYDKIPKAYLIHIKGYEWEFQEGITMRASENLNKAFMFFKKILKDLNSVDKYIS
ncbi:MAG: hydrogenase maturation protease [Bacteroidota bacterium]